MKRLLFITANLCLACMFALSATASAGGDDEDNDPNNGEVDNGVTVITLHEIPGTATNAVIHVDARAGFTTFDLRINLPQTVNTDKVRVITTKYDDGSIDIEVDDIEHEQGDPAFMVDPFVLVGITEDDLSGEEPTRLANTNVAIAGPNGAQPRMVVQNPNSYITVESITFGGIREAPTSHATIEGSAPIVESTEGTLLSSDVTVFPNPTTGAFNVVFNTDVAIDKMNIISILGRVVYTSQMPQKRNEVNLSEMPAGIYFVEATAGEQRIAKRVVVDH